MPSLTKAAFAACLSVCLIAASPAEAEGRGSEAIRAFVESRAAQTNLSGTILVTEEERALYAGSFGLAERTFETPARTDTRYPIASITKLFTAVMVLQLVESGKLRLDATLATYYPDYPGGGADRVTIRQLLHHTSGLAQFDTVGSYQEAFARGLPNHQRPMTTDELLRLCCGGPLGGIPGKAFNYNNTDYFVLGRIIERASGMPYAEVLRRRILEPLGLRDTGMLQWDSVVPRLASTYFFRDDNGRLVASMPVYWESWYAAGAMYSSVGDIATFADALFGGRVVSATSLGELLAPGLDEYGLGLWSYKFARNGRTYRVAKRPGSIMGANTVLYRLRDVGVTIVILANTNRSDLDVFAQRLAEALIDLRQRSPTRQRK